MRSSPTPCTTRSARPGGRICTRTRPAPSCAQSRPCNPRTSCSSPRHTTRAGQDAEALEWTLRAGDDALANLAPAAAVQHFEAALELASRLVSPDTERAELLVRLGTAEYRAGDTDALTTLNESIVVAQRSDRSDVVVRAALAMDSGFMRLHDWPDQLAATETALKVVDPADREAVSRLQGLLARSLLSMPDAERRLAAAHEALDIAHEVGDPTLLAQVSSAVSVALWSPGRSATRAHVAAEAVRAADTAGDPRLQFGAATSAFYVAIETADHTVAMLAAANLRAAATQVREPHLIWAVNTIEVFELTMAGRLAEAEALATTNLELGTQIGLRDAFTVFAGQAFAIGTFAGRHRELFPLVEQAMADSPDVVPFRLAYGLICLAVDRDDDARAILAEGVEAGFDAIPMDNMWATTVIGYAIISIELADVAPARTLLPIVESFANEVTFNGATSQGPVAAYAGKLASLVGDYERAEKHLRAALAVAVTFGWQYHRATTLYALAENRHRQTGVLDPESRAWITTASELCRTSGFTTWIPRIDRLLCEV